MAENLNSIGYHPPPVSYSFGGSRNWYTSSGAPTTTASEGSLNLDKDSGDIYEMQSGSWVLITTAGGGGSGPDVKFGAFTDPNGNVTGNVDDFYKSVEASGGDGTVWVKQTGNGTNTGWI